MTQKLKGVETPKPQAETLAAPDVGTGTPGQFISELAQVTLVPLPQLREVLSLTLVKLESSVLPPVTSVVAEAGLQNSWGVAWVSVAAAAALLRAVLSGASYLPSLNLRENRGMVRILICKPLRIMPGRS